MNELDLVAEERLVITNAIEREAHNAAYWGDEAAARALSRIVDMLKDGRI